MRYLLIILSFNLLFWSCGDCIEVEVCHDYDACNYKDENPCYGECCDNMNSSSYENYCYEHCLDHWSYEGGGGGGGFASLLAAIGSTFYCSVSYIENNSLCLYPEDYGWETCDCY